MIYKLNLRYIYLNFKSQMNIYIVTGMKPVHTRLAIKSEFAKGLAINEVIRVAAYSPNSRTTPMMASTRFTFLSFVSFSFFSSILLLIGLFVHLICLLTV